VEKPVDLPGEDGQEERKTVDDVDRELGIAKERLTKRRPTHTGQAALDHRVELGQVLGVR
jgi:hypothetical protein